MFRSRLSRVKNSLRTTVPKGIVDLLELKQGDILVWRVKFEGDKFIIYVEVERK